MSQFKPGAARPPNSGRKKGSLNKLKKVADVLAKNDIDPVKEILQIINETDFNKKISEGMKLDAWFQLLSYCEAKPKEIDFSSDDESSEDLVDTPTEALLRLVKDHNGVK